MLSREVVVIVPRRHLLKARDRVRLGVAVGGLVRVHEVLLGGERVVEHLSDSRLAEVAIIAFLLNFLVLLVACLTLVLRVFLRLGRTSVAGFAPEITVDDLRGDMTALHLRVTSTVALFVFRLFPTHVSFPMLSWVGFLQKVMQCHSS